MRSRTARVRMHSRLLGFLKSSEDAKSGMNGMPMRAIFTIRVIMTSRMTLEFEASNQMDSSFVKVKPRQLS